MTPIRIISGGQAGVDRGALDAAMEAGWPCGGWCPAGRRAEDGRIPDRYPLAETAETDYSVRTRLNVRDSDGTLILGNGELSGGTRLTRDLCDGTARPCLVLRADRVSVDEAIEQASGFVTRYGIGVLNMAGPRASDWGAAAAFASAVVGGLVARTQPGEDRRAPDNADRLVIGGEQEDPRQT